MLTIKQPVGVVAAITPWNFPFSMITWKVAPARGAHALSSCQRRRRRQRMHWRCLHTRLASLTVRFAATMSGSFVSRDKPSHTGACPSPECLPSLFGLCACAVAALSFRLVDRIELNVPIVEARCASVLNRELTAVSCVQVC
jgi:hypothetical protein